MQSYGIFNSPGEIFYPGGESCPEFGEMNPLKSLRKFLLSVLFISMAMIILTVGEGRAGDLPTETPIKHVIVIIGENRSFDDTFGAFVPPPGQFVLNILSERIIGADGKPGINVQSGRQKEASDLSRYSVAPNIIGEFSTLPSPGNSEVFGSHSIGADPMFPPVLPNAPFQITRYVPYRDTFVGSPVHRFFQMWQETDKGAMDLFPWVGMTAGEGGDGNAPPSPFGQETTGEGSVSMGFYNMSAGDEPVLSRLARHYALADNYHQVIMGGTGANHIAIGTADVAFYRPSGIPSTPPLAQIENPDPRKGGLISASGVAEGNVYTNDGYGDHRTGMGGNYVECENLKSPGVGSIRRYLSQLHYRVFSPGGPADCAPKTYYLVNNYDPAYDGQGVRIPLVKTPFLASPQSIPSIGDALSAKGVSWGYFGQGWNHGHPTKEYCAHCNPFQFETSVMTTDLRKNLQGYKDFRIRVEKGTLPSVSFVKPGNSVDGHPGYSSLSKFERFLEKTVALIRSHPELYKNTAIFITFDEGGGYYDSGYIQPLWFFGDGTRVPLILISPFARRGFVDHTYYNHVSLIKFIEKNWHLGPLSKRSLDNLPNPIMPRFPEHPESLPPDRQRSFYIPQNRPSIGDLTNLFDFSHRD